VILRHATRNLLSNKLRLVLTSLTVVLGVSFVVGAFVLGDTVNRAFDNVFATANEGVAVQVQGVATVSEADRQPVPAELVPRIAAVEGVATAVGQVFGIAQIIGSDGEPAGLSGPPALGFGWTDDPQLNPLRIVSGTAPREPADVVIDSTTADAEDFAIGDRVRIITAAGSDEYRLVGIVAFGEANNLAGATLTAFTTETAQRVLDSEGRFASVGVTGDPGVADTELARRIQAVLPDGFEAITGEAAAQEASDQFKQFVDLFRNFLLVFAAIALFVGSFIIFNAFRVTVAQRTRQLGLLRAVGASGGQVVRTVMTEALLIGTAASMIGVAAGLGLALLMRAGFNLVGASLPATALQVEVRSIVAGFVVGLLVTLSAALAPALRASRVSPMAAMRDAPAGDARRSRAIVSTALAAGGAALVLVGLWSSAELGVRFGLIGLGAMLLFVGAAMLTRYLVAPLARVIGAPLAKAGLAGRLGRENAIRNPARTAQTAAALTIGVALVAGVTIFGSSLSATFLGTLDTRVRADLVVLSSSQAPFSSTAAAALTANPALSAVSAWRDGEFRDARDETRGVSALDPDGLGQLYDPAVSAGAMSDLARPGTIAVHEDYASENDLEPGSTMTVRFSRTGAVPLRVAAVFTDDTFSDFFISLDEYERNYTTQQDVVILARAAEGVSPEDAKAAAEAALTDFPNLDVRTKAEYKDVVAGQIDGLLRVFYVLLAMAVLIAIFGIVLTLALSVFERTREIGLLRAVGLSRASVRAMIRWESVIVSLIGAVVGLALGVFLGAVSVLSVPIVETLSIPWVSLVVFLLAAALLGVLAAILPARRAARLDILDAIRHE